MQIIPRIDDVDGIDLDDLFYTDDEVAMMKYNAFMFEIGLEEESEESAQEETNDELPSFMSHDVDVASSVENIGASELSLTTSSSISRRAVVDETSHPLSPKIYRRRKSQTTSSGWQRPLQFQVVAPKVVPSRVRPLRQSHTTECSSGWQRPLQFQVLAPKVVPSRGRPLRLPERSY